MIRVFESESSRTRRDAARDFARSFPAGTEIAVLGEHRETVDDFVRELAVESAATFGWHRFSWAQLVATLAADELADRGLAPSSVLGTEASCARVAFALREDDRIDRLAHVSAFPGFARALAATIEELRAAGLDPSALAGEAEVRDLALLWSAYETELATARVADGTRLLELARSGLARRRREHLRRAPMLLLDLAIRSEAQRAFLNDLVRESTDVLATIPALDDETIRAWRSVPGAAFSRSDPAHSSSLERLQAFLFSDDVTPGPIDDERVRFFSAPGEGRECVEIARQILALAEGGTRFDEIAIVLRTPEWYAGHLETALRRAKIPAFFARGTKRPDPSGRAFLALLACRAEGLSAKRFSEYLSFGEVPTPDESGRPPSGREEWAPPDVPAADPVQLSFDFVEEDRDAPAIVAPDTDASPELEGSLRAPWKWEEFLVEAAVIGGKDRWRRRLAGLERELQLKHDELASDDPGSPRLGALQRSVENLAHLERFALPLIDRLDALPERGTWGEWLRALSELAPRALRRPARVLSLLSEMQPMAEIDGVTIEEVRGVLTDRLSTLEQDHPETRYGRIFVATPHQLRGRSFRVAFIPGLAERIFPQRPREDPLLLDAVRQRLSPRLRLQEDRGHEERMLLRLAVGTAEREIVVSYPRAEVAEARPRVPSFYALDIARATRGELPPYETLEREAAAAANARLAWPAPERPRTAIDAVEHDLAVLGPLLHDAPAWKAKGRARYLLELNPHLARSLRTRWLRWRSRKWDPADGIVRTTRATTPILAEHRLTRRPFSVTALQRFSVCPYQFFLSAIHRLEPREEAAAVIRLDPLTRGRLIHETQARTLRALRDAQALPLTEGRMPLAEERLDRVVDEVEAKYREELAPAIARVWQDEIDEIRSDMRIWLRRLADRAGEWVPLYFEYTFGLGRDDGYDAHSRAEPVSLPGGWMLRGAVDLIERHRDGNLRVVDHKTGQNRTTEGWIVGRGETLQPVLYSFAVEAALQETVTEARLSYSTTRGGFTECVVPMNEFARLYGAQVLETIDAAIESGALPPAPRKDACKLCDFRSVCGPSEENRTARKDKHLLEPLHHLRSLP